MNLQNIDTLLFDLGGVLIDWNPRYVFRQIFETEEEMDYFFDNICTSDWNEQQDAGRSLQQATAELLLKHPHYAEPIRAYYGRWEEMLGGPIEETVEILKQIYQTKSHRLYALTNWSAETFPVALERYDFLGLFTDILVSGVEKLKKPDPAIYQLAIDRFDLQASRTLFIDDNARNVAAAQKLGMQTHHFTEPKNLRDLLQL